MNLFKCELRKSIIETLAYYPDFIVGSITSMILFFVLLNGRDDYVLFLVSYLFWVVASGVLSEASIAISTEKQLGTLQNLFIKPYSILTIIIVKTFTWFLINLVRTIIILGIIGIFFPISEIFNIKILIILVLACIGVLGLALILCSMTLMYTKVASFETIISYMLLLLSGTLISLPDYIIYTNPISLGTKIVGQILNSSLVISDLLIMIGINFIYFLIGILFFNFMFKRSKNFRWTY